MLAGPLVAGSERGDGVGRRRRHGADEIGRDVAVAEIGEPVPVERFAKVQEGERFVDVFVEFVRHVGVAAAEHLSGFVAPDAAVGISAVALSRQRLDQRAAVKRLTVAFFAESRVQQQAVAGDLDEPPAGQDIEADHRDAVRRETFRHDAHERLAQRLGDPAQEAVTNDVVEGAVLSPDLVQAAGVERDIGEPGPGDPVAPRGDLQRRDVDAEKARLGPGGGERNEVAAGGAADLEHARRRDVRRLDAGPERGGRHPRRLEARVGQRFVGRPVVARPRAGDGVAEVGRRRLRRPGAGHRRRSLRLAQPSRSMRSAR